MWEGAGACETRLLQGRRGREGFGRGGRLAVRRFAAIGLSLTMLGLTACQKIDEAEFNERVRIYLLEHPEAIEAGAQRLRVIREAQAVHNVRATLGMNRQALERDPRDFVANPNGKITVVEFFDYRCGFCKSGAPEVMKLIEQNPDVRFVFKQLPVFGGASNVAARVALTDVAKPKSLELYRAFMAEKALDERAIDRHLIAAGIDPVIAKADGKTSDIQKQLDDTRVLAQALDVEGTPAFFVGDRKIAGADMEKLQGAIVEARRMQGPSEPIAAGR